MPSELIVTAPASGPVLQTGPLETGPVSGSQTGPESGPGRAEVFTLENGLRVVAERRRGPGFAFSLRLPLGSAHDPQGVQGTASVTEEWLNKGAGEYSARAFQDALDDLGLRRGGGVGAESTGFSASGLSADLGAALALHADLVRRPQLPDAEFGVLRDLARQDLEAMRDSPAEVLALEARARAFPAPAGPFSGYAHPASGTAGGLAALTPQRAREFFGRYGAAGSVLGVVSDHEPGQVRDLAEQHFGDWGRGADPDPVPLHFAAGGTLHLPGDGAQAHLSLFWRGVDPHSRDWLPWHLSLGVLSGGAASRLFVAVREERGLAYAAQAGAQLLGGQGFVSAYAGSTPERADETLEVTLSELRRLREGVSADEFARAREALIVSSVFGAESIRGRAASLVRDLVVLGEVRSPARLRAQLEAVTLQDVNDFLARWQPGEPNLVTLGLPGAR